MPQIRHERPDGGLWEITLQLDSGKHTYKFVVDGNWQFDQANPRFEDDGYGGSNSLIEIDQNGNLIADFSEYSGGGVKSSFNPKVYFKGRYFFDEIF